MYKFWLTEQHQEKNVKLGWEYECLHRTELIWYYFKKVENMLFLDQPKDLYCFLLCKYFSDKSEMCFFFVYWHVYENQDPLKSFDNGSELSLFDYTRCKLVMHGIVECLNILDSRFSLSNSNYDIYKEKKRPS